MCMRAWGIKYVERSGMTYSTTKLYGVWKFLYLHMSSWLFRMWRSQRISVCYYMSSDRFRSVLWMASLKWHGASCLCGCEMRPRTGPQRAWNGHCGARIGIRYRTQRDEWISTTVTFIILMWVVLGSNPHRESIPRYFSGFPLGYELDDRGSKVRFPVGAGNFSLHHRVQNGSGTHPASYPTGTRVSFPGGKATWAWSWPLTSM
jgi:hypothetical protein